MTDPLDWATARRTGQEILDEIRTTIAGIYRRPRMYGRDGGEVDTLLWILHDLVAVAGGRRAEFSRLDDSARMRAGCSALHFADHCRQAIHENRPVPEAEVITHVIEQWKYVDQLMGLEIPPEGGRP